MITLDLDVPYTPGTLSGFNPYEHDYVATPPNDPLGWVGVDNRPELRFISPGTPITVTGNDPDLPYGVWTGEVTWSDSHWIAFTPDSTEYLGDGSAAWDAYVNFGDCHVLTYREDTLSINWETRVIYIPRGAMTLVQAVPTEIRELDLDIFRLTLKSLEDDEEGMLHLDTHRHNPPTAVGGVELAMVVEIINGYTITFENGQYSVNLSGANSNVADVVNPNQVSVRSANSAGLVQSKEIQFASFENAVWIDTDSTVTGTLYPAGTRRTPVNNLADAMTIANYRGLTEIGVLGDLLVDDGGDYHGMIFHGESKTKTTFTIDMNANVYGCEFYSASVQGLLDGNCVLKDCEIGDLYYISGYIENCVLAPGTISLGGGDAAQFLNCVAGVRGVEPPTIDCGGDGPALTLRNYNGRVQLVNKTGLATVTIDLNSGEVNIGPTVTAGSVIIRGVGKCADESTGSAVVDCSYLLNAENISDTSGARPIDGQITLDQTMRVMAAAMAGKVSGAGGATITFRDMNDTKDRIVADVDVDGNRTTVVLDAD